jgi:hypothetical protein
MRRLNQYKLTTETPKSIQIDFPRFERVKIAEKKREKSPSNFSGSLPKKFSAKQNFSGKSGGYF